MIYLTNPLLYQGRIIPEDEVVTLDPDFEAAIVAAGNAEYIDEETDPPEEDPPKEDPPEEEPPEGDPELLLGRAGT